MVGEATLLLENPPAADTENPPAADTENPPATGAKEAEAEKSNTHWKAWEIGCLIDLCVEGKPFPVIAATLRRSAAACSREWLRLLNSEKECPTIYRPALEAARAKFQSQLNNPKQPAGKGGTAYEKMLNQVCEQYRQLARSGAEIKASMSDVEKLLTYSLALDVAAGRISYEEISHFCPPDAVRTVLETAGHISEFRRRQRGLGGGTFTADEAENPPAADAEKPLVVTGPGGDFQHETMPSDIA